MRKKGAALFLFQCVLISKLKLLILTSLALIKQPTDCPDSTGMGEQSNRSSGEVTNTILLSVKAKTKTRCFLYGEDTVFLYEF